MIIYLLEFGKSLLRHGLWWWLCTIVAALFGAGFWHDYPLYRDQISGWQPWITLPNEYSFVWFLLVPVLVWLVISLAHSETMRELRRARLFFSEPRIDQLPLFNNGIFMEHIQMARIEVHNLPRDMTHGRDVEAAFCEAHFFRRSDGRKVGSVDYCRWLQNEKPGRDGNPNRFVDAWKWRPLSANGDKHIIDFAMKGSDDTCIWGFAGSSQLKPGWRAPKLKTDESEVLVQIVVKGKGLRKPAEEWLVLQLGSDLAIDVQKTSEKPMRYWYGD